jgi:hypothetical protein
MSLRLFLTLITLAAVPLEAIAEQTVCGETERPGLG